MIIIDEGIITIEKGEFATIDSAGKILDDAAGLGDDVDDTFEVLGGNRVEFKARRPARIDEKTISPAQTLPDSFGDEWGERVKHLENHLEGDFEKGNILVNLLTFDEPVSVFIPDSRGESLDGFGEAIFLEIIFDFFFALGEFATNPIFTNIIGRIGKLSASENSAFVDNLSVKFVCGDFESGKTISLGFVDHALNESC